MIGAWAARDWLRPKISSHSEQAVQPREYDPLEGGVGHLSCVSIQGPTTSAISDMRCNERQ